MGVSAAMGVRTRARSSVEQVETRAQWKAKPVFHFCTANRARVVPIYAVGGSDRTRSWPRWPEHTRAPVEVQPWPLRAYLLLPGGCCFRGFPWSPLSHLPARQLPSVAAPMADGKTEAWKQVSQHSLCSADRLAGQPCSQPEVAELPGSPPCPSRLNSAQLPTQGPHFAPTTCGHCGRGLFPTEAPSARSDQEPA